MGNAELDAVFFFVFRVSLVKCDRVFVISQGKRKERRQTYRQDSKEDHIKNMSGNAFPHTRFLQIVNHFHPREFIGLLQARTKPLYIIIYLDIKIDHNLGGI